MKRGKYTKTLAKIQTRKYSVYEISEEMFYPNLQRFIRRRHAGAHLDGHQHGGRKPIKTSVTQFWYKSVNLFLKELINIKVMLFLIHEMLRQQNSPKYVTFLTYMKALSAVMKMPRHAIAQKFKCTLSQNQEPCRSENLYEYQFSAALIHHVKCQQDRQFCSLNFSEVM